MRKIAIAIIVMLATVASASAMSLKEAFTALSKVPNM